MQTSKPDFKRDTLRTVRDAPGDQAQSEASGAGGQTCFYAVFFPGDDVSPGNPAFW